MTNAVILIMTLLMSLVLDEDVPRVPFVSVYNSQLIRFARVSSHLADFNSRKKTLTSWLPNYSNRGIGIINFGKSFFFLFFFVFVFFFFFKFYQQHYELVS